jgi:hypothetical protein
VQGSPVLHVDIWLAFGSLTAHSRKNKSGANMVATLAAATSGAAVQQRSNGAAERCQLLRARGQFSLGGGTASPLH